MMQATASALASSRIQIRRIPDVWQQVPPAQWLGLHTPIVSWGTEGLASLQQRGWQFTAFDVMMGPTSLGTLAAFMQQARQRLPGLFEKDTTPSTIPSFRVQSLDPNLLSLGALDIRDMAYLGGGALGSLYRLSNSGRLPPRHVGKGGRTPVWSFAQLIAFRTWRYFASKSIKRQFPMSLVPELEHLASAEDASRLGVTSRGELLESDGRGWFNRRTGQEVLAEFLPMDRVFEPFSLGDGLVPDMLRPSANIEVNPTRLGAHEWSVVEGLLLAPWQKSSESKDIYQCSTRFRA